MKSKPKFFVPFSEPLMAAAGFPIGELVPFQLEYECVRLLDGTLELRALCEPSEAPALPNRKSIGQAA